MKAINQLAHALVPVILLGVFCAATFAPQGPAPVPCSNTGTKETADANLLTTSMSTDCNGDGTKDCGYEEILWPKIFACDVAGSLDGYCCKTFVAFSQKRIFVCDGAVCTTAGWVNDQAFTQATPLQCNGTNQNSDCNR